jgi:hypothetical protein
MYTSSSNGPRSAEGLSGRSGVRLSLPGERKFAGWTGGCVKEADTGESRLGKVVQAKGEQAFLLDAVADKHVVLQVSLARGYLTADRIPPSQQQEGSSKQQPPRVDQRSICGEGRPDQESHFPPPVRATDSPSRPKRGAVMKRPRKPPRLGG